MKPYLFLTTTAMLLAGVSNRCSASNANPEAISAINRVSDDYTARSDAGYKSIFDGKSLDGWHTMQVQEASDYYATEGNFYVKDNVLHCFQLPNKKGGLLLSDEQYADFELVMDIKSDWGCDSGIFLRCTEDGRGIQILNDYLKDGVVGFVYGQGTGGYISFPLSLTMKDGGVSAEQRYDPSVDRLAYSISPEDWNKIWKHGDWNTLKIRCVGEVPMITTWINGVKVMDLDGATFSARSLGDVMKDTWTGPSSWSPETIQKITGGRGSIALQIHPWGRWKQGGSAMYRNIRIKEL